MARPRFLADHDFNEDILRGLERREPLMDIARARDAGLAAVSDAVVLEHAAVEGRVLLSHDVRTMIAAAVARIVAGRPMAGLIIAHQHAPIGRVISDLQLIWSVCEADEYINLVQRVPL